MSSSFLEGEKNLLDQIVQVEQVRIELRERIEKLRKNLIDTESDLIEANIKLDRLREELRVYRKVTPGLSVSDREKEIESLREKLPRLLAIIADEKKLV